MRKIKLIGTFLVCALAVALLFLIPTTAHAATPNELEYYVDIETFSNYLRNTFWETNEDLDRSIYLIDFTQYNMPSNAALKEDILRHSLLAVPELATVNSYTVETDVHNTYIAGLDIIFNNSSYKNNSYFYAIQRAAAPLLEGVEGNDALSEVEKALILHDRLALLSSSNNGSYTSTTYSAYGALVNRSAASSGYADAYSYLLARVGIYSKSCYSLFWGHDWNIVYIDGIPYHVDVDQDDPDRGSNVNHNYFLLSTDRFYEIGVPSTDYDTSPQDTRYDHANWNTVTTAFQLVNGKLYYASPIDGYIYQWTIDGSTPISYAGWYTQLNSVGDKLLYSSQDSIYMLDPETGEDSFVCDLTCPDPDKILEGFLYEKSHVIGIFSSGNYTQGNYEQYQASVFFVLPGETGWRKDPYGSIYLDADGNLVKDCWMKDPVGWRYLGSDGYAVYEQWQMDSQGWCYLNKDGYVATNEWARDSYGWSWMDSNGRITKNSWVRDKFGLYYVDDTGYRLNNTWLYDGTGWRHLGAHGRSDIGEYIDSDGKHYYMDENGYMVTGWRYFERGWSYFDKNGVMARSGWFRDTSGRWCYANSLGTAIADGWVRFDGNSYSLGTDPAHETDASCRYYYIGADCYMRTGWTQIKDIWYYFDATGCRVTSSWVQDSAGWCYLNDKGHMLTDLWIYDNGSELSLNAYSSIDANGGKLYYIDSQGHMAVGWKEINGFWFWFDSDGVKANNRWVQDSAGWCYLGNAGNTLIHCWVEDSTGKCYLDANGRMVTNTWINYQNSWYYVDGNGHQCTGWKLIGNKWYYFNSSGVMLKNCWIFETETGLKAVAGYTKDSRRKYTSYYLQESGAAATGWTKIDNQWFWFASSGVMAKDDWMQDSIGWCRLDQDGSMLTNCWQKDSKGTCYIGASGYILKNTWLQLQGCWYYLDGNGYRASGWLQLGGKWYYFYSSGVMATNTSMSGGWINANGVWKAY